MEEGKAKKKAGPAQRLRLPAADTKFVSAQRRAGVWTSEKSGQAQGLRFGSRLCPSGDPGFFSLGLPLSVPPRSHSAAGLSVISRLRDARGRLSVVGCLQGRLARWLRWRSPRPREEIGGGNGNGEVRWDESWAHGGGEENGGEKHREGEGKGRGMPVAALPRWPLPFCHCLSSVCSLLSALCPLAGARTNGRRFAIKPPSPWSAPCALQPEDGGWGEMPRREKGEEQKRRSSIKGKRTRTRGCTEQAGDEETDSEERLSFPRKQPRGEEGGGRLRAAVRITRPWEALSPPLSGRANSVTAASAELRSEMQDVQMSVTSAPPSPLSGERPSARQPLACPSRQLQHKFRVDPLRVLKRGRRYVSGATCGQEHAAAEATKQRPKQQQGRAGDKTSMQAGRQQTSERERSEAQASEGSAAPAQGSPPAPACCSGPASLAFPLLAASASLHRSSRPARSQAGRRVRAKGDRGLVTSALGGPA